MKLVGRRHGVVARKTRLVLRSLHAGNQGRFSSSGVSNMYGIELRRRTGYLCGFRHVLAIAHGQKQPTIFTHWLEVAMGAVGLEKLSHSG
jgi:hypothetical protein